MSFEVNNKKYEGFSGFLLTLLAVPIVMSIMAFIAAVFILIAALLLSPLALVVWLVSLIV